MELSVNHVTTFRYGRAVVDSVDEVRLRPRTDAHQVCLDFRLITDPRAEVRAYTDYFGNVAHTFDIQTPHATLVVIARSRVRTDPSGLPADVDTLPDPFRPLAWEAAGELIEFLQPTSRADFHPAIRAFANEMREARPRRLGALLWGLSRELHASLSYVAGATDVGTTAGTAFGVRRGVCQDYTHILLAALRMLGVPARYTSGYFHPEGAAREVTGQASHAWVEAWFPDSGWIGVDPANDHVVDERYIRVAYGRDYADVAPIKGNYRGAGPGTLDVDVTVGADVPHAVQQQ